MVGAASGNPTDISGQQGSPAGNGRKRSPTGRLLAGSASEGNANAAGRNEDPGIGLASRPSGAVKHSPYLQFHLLKALYFRIVKGRRF